MSQTTRAALCYLAVLPAGIVAAFFASGATISGVNALPRAVWSSDVVGWLINVVPPLCAGLVTFGLLASWLSREGWLQPTMKAHLGRTSSLYLLVSWCAWLLIRSWHSSDLGLWGQIPLWSGLAALGGIAADALLALRARRASLHPLADVR